MFSGHFNGLVCFSRVAVVRVECLWYSEKMLVEELMISRGLVSVEKPFSGWRPNITDDPAVNHLARDHL